MVTLSLNLMAGAADQGLAPCCTHENVPTVLITSVLAALCPSTGVPHPVQAFFAHKGTVQSGHEGIFCCGQQ